MNRPPAALPRLVYVDPDDATDNGTDNKAIAHRTPEIVELLGPFYLGNCSARDWPGPVGACGNRIGQIGYRSDGGEIVCFRCYVARERSKTEPRRSASA